MKAILYLLLTLTIPINSTLIKNEQYISLKSKSQKRKLMILPFQKKAPKTSKITLKRDLLGLSDIMSGAKKLIKGIKKFFGFLFKLKTAIIIGTILIVILFCIEDSQVFCPFRIIQDMLKSLLGRWLQNKRIPKFIKNNDYIRNLHKRDQGFKIVKMAMVRYLKDNFYDFKRTDVDKDVFFDITKGFVEDVYGRQKAEVNFKMKKVMHLLFRNKRYIFEKVVQGNK